MDLFGGVIVKGAVYKPCSSKNVTTYYATINGKVADSDKTNLPKEIVETWQPVYKNDVFVGDWVFSDTPNVHKDILGGEWGFVGVLLEIKTTSFTAYRVSVYHSDYESQMLTKDKYVWCSTVRPATPQEILKARDEAKLAEARILFPAGTIFAPAHQPSGYDHCIVTNTNFKISKYNNIEAIVALTDSGTTYVGSTMENSKYGNCVYERIVCYGGKWADIIKNPIIKIKGYSAKFSDTEVSFGCQTYPKEFILMLNKCLQANGFLFECTKEVQKMADYFESKS
jgi:hypothetical protein